MSWRFQIVVKMARRADAKITTVWNNILSRSTMSQVSVVPSVNFSYRRISHLGYSTLGLGLERLLVHSFSDISL